MDEKRDFGRLIKHISEEMRKNANNAMRSQNMTMAQMETLMELASTARGQLSLKELEQRLHVAQSTAAGIVVRLEQKGFVKGLGDPADKRVKLVRITQAGLDCATAARQKMYEAQAELLSCLTRTEQDIFVALLKKICDGLS